MSENAFVKIKCDGISSDNAKLSVGENALRGVRSIDIQMALGMPITCQIEAKTTAIDLSAQLTGLSIVNPHTGESLEVEKIVYKNGKTWESPK